MMIEKTEFLLTLDEVEEIYREGWQDGASFDGDFSNELAADEVENAAWADSHSRADLLCREQEDLSNG